MEHGSQTDGNQCVGIRQQSGCRSVADQGCKGQFQELPLGHLQTGAGNAQQNQRKDSGKQEPVEDQSVFRHAFQQDFLHEDRQHTVQEARPDHRKDTVFCTVVFVHGTNHSTIKELCMHDFPGIPVFFRNMH